MMIISLKKLLKLSGISLLIISGCLTFLNSSIAINIELKQQNINYIEEKPDRDLSQYIGVRYSDYEQNKLLKNFSSNGGNIIGNSNSKYTLAEFLDKESDRVIILLEKIISKNSKIQPIYEILDAISISLKEYDIMAVFEADTNYKGDYRLIRFACFVGDRPDPEIIAIVKNEPYADRFRNILKAWRANRKNNKIVEISPQLISCENIYPPPGEIP